jgi:putative flippase GtrA
MQLPTYFRYIAASGVSLCVDFALFMAGLSVHVLPAIAAAVGYLGGLVCHWLISSRFVFADRIAATGAQRWQQQALFAGSAFIGLALTMAIVGAFSAEGFDPRIGKLVAIAVSFQATYLLRKKVVFA